jgi:hypothetical protein
MTIIGSGGLAKQLTPYAQACPEGQRPEFVFGQRTCVAMGLPQGLETKTVMVIGAAALLLVLLLGRK